MSTFPFSGGSSTVNSYGQQSQFQFSDNVWSVGDQWTAGITSTLEGDFTIGAGRLVAAMLSSPTPQQLKTLAARVYLAAGSSFYYCDNVDIASGQGPTEWEQQGAGANVIKYTGQYGVQDNVYGFESQQGRLAVFGRYSIQIWGIDADPANFSRIQVLVNVGCQYPNTIHGLGDWDVLFLDDSGLRSLRTKEVTLNAEPVDIGSAVDTLVKKSIANLSTIAPCGEVEPVNKRYWSYIADTLYVLSYFKSNKIAAWSTYSCVYNLPTTSGADNLNYDISGNDPITSLSNGQVYEYSFTGPIDIGITINGVQSTANPTYFMFHSGDTIVANGQASQPCSGVITSFSPVTFTPIKMVVYNGLVYLRDSNGNLTHYTEKTYDNTQATVVTPYMDDKRAAEVKAIQAMDIAMSGGWEVELGTDPASDNYQDVYVSGTPNTPSQKTDSSFDFLRVGYKANATHFSFKAVSSIVSFSKETIASLLLHYNKAGQR